MGSMGPVSYPAARPHTAVSGSEGDLEPDAGAGLLALESPALRDLVDELEPASALVLPVGFAPVREPDLAVVDDVDVHDRAAAHHRDGDPGGVGGVLHRVRHELTGEQLGLERGGVAGQGVPDKPAGDRNLVRTAVEATGGSHRRRI